MYLFELLHIKEKMSTCIVFLTHEVLKKKFLYKRILHVLYTNSFRASLINPNTKCNTKILKNNS